MTDARPRGPLWLIDPSRNHAETQGCETIARLWPGECRVFQPALRPGDGPRAADGHRAAAVVVMGSAASVHDDDTWLAELGDWLRPLVSGEIRRPLLGICFGHQLLAHVAGGAVDWMAVDRAKRAGIEATHLDGGRLLPGRHVLRVVVSHREAVVRCPTNYRITASRPGVPIDGLEHETLPLFSFQFHPEARDEFAASAGLPPGAIDDAVRADSQRLIGAFLGLVARTDVQPDLGQKKAGG